MELSDSLLATDKPARWPFLMNGFVAAPDCRRSCGRFGAACAGLPRVPESGCPERHAWDIGISRVRRVLAEALNAALAGSKLFAPAPRLQLSLNLGHVDPQSRRIDPASRKHELEGKKPCSGALRSAPPVTKIELDKTTDHSPLAKKTLDGAKLGFTGESNSCPR